MRNIEMKIPQYIGTETTNEDVVYSFFRLIMAQRGYSFRVKRTGYREIDSIIPSVAGTIGRGSCDAYIFSGERANSFCGLLELESTGNIEVGILQIQKYATGFNDPMLSVSEKSFVASIVERNIKLIVFDGQILYVSFYNLDTGIETVYIDKEPIDDLNSKLLFDFFPCKSSIIRETDEKAVIENVARIIRGNEKIQKNKAFIMTVLSSIYGETKNTDLDEAIKELKDSQIKYQQTLYKMWQEMQILVGETDKIQQLYDESAADLYELSQERGMDLYGFIYEELATRDKKREQGEYYTPRHTIRPLIAAVFENYLKWSKEELAEKTVADIFCGSGGFLYEYVYYLRKKYNLTQEEINNITEDSIWGFDKNGVLSAQLNMYLVGDGETNLFSTNTSINWRKHFIYKAKDKKKYDIEHITDEAEVKKKLAKNIIDINRYLKLYVGKDFNLELSDIQEFISDEDAIEKSVLKKTRKKNVYELGNVDLLITNVPYGKVTDATDQIVYYGQKKYGNSLEVNAIHECVDLLKPAKVKNGKTVEEGGVAIIIVPDSILENSTNKEIRDYIITRCDILAIISLPEFTFSPYAMEKTYALVVQKLSPEQFSYERNIKSNTFMYYSCCDGRANSKNRYRTNHIQTTKIHDITGKEKNIMEFIHNDFEPCFQPYDGELHYVSKIERAWNYNTYICDPDWDQDRVLEAWNKDGWIIKKGKKWGYFELRRVERIRKREISFKTLSDKIGMYFEGLSEEDIEDRLSDMEAFITEIRSNLRLTAKELGKISEVKEISYDKVSGKIGLITYETIRDIDMNIDSDVYLGMERQCIKIEEVEEMLESLTFRSVDELVDFFSNEFISDIYMPDRLMDSFYIKQGTQFSKEDAYLNPGQIPVYTAATDGPAYYVEENIPGKVMIVGSSLIWSRKGAKAGTIQIFTDSINKFYISDVSGTIQPKENMEGIDFLFLKYYIEGQVKRERQSVANNAQLNKSKLENLKIYLPNNQKSIGKKIMKILRRFS